MRVFIAEEEKKSKWECKETVMLSELPNAHSARSSHGLHMLLKQCVSVFVRETKREIKDHAADNGWIICFSVSESIFYCVGVCVFVSVSPYVCLYEQSFFSMYIQESTFFASESLSSWQLSACSLSGFESRVTWSTRSSFSSNCLSRSARFTSSYSAETERRHTFFVFPLKTFATK